MPANREQPLLLQLADQTDDVMGLVARIIRPVEHLIPADQLSTFRKEAADFQRRIEGAAAAASLAQSLISCGLPQSRDASVYRQIVQSVK